MEGIPEGEEWDVIEARPPCRVCNGPGKGFHYGVNTCDACKGFFHRSLSLKLEYKCLQDGSCHVQYGTGLICRLCRFKKCIAVGMAKDASRTGRYSLKKRNEIILEMKRMKDSSRLKSHLKEVKTLKTEPDSTQQSDEINTSLSSFQYHDSKPEQAQSTIMGFSLVPTSSLIQGTTNVYRGTASPMPLPELSDCKRPENKALHSLNQALSHAMSKSEPSDYVRLQKNLSFLDSQYSMSMLQASSFITEPSKKLHHGPMPRVTKERIIELYADKDAVLETLLDANRSAFSYIYDNWSLDTLQEDTYKHYELCNLRSQCGQMKRESDYEYDSPIVGDRDRDQELISKSFGDTEVFLRKLIQFIRRVPGFKSLNVDDKVKLIKYGCFEFCLILSHQYCNTDLGVIRFTKNSYVCRRDAPVFELSSADIFDDHVEACRKLQTLDLRFEERVILQAMSILAPDRSNLAETNYEIVYEIYWNLAQILLHVLGKRFRNPHRPFAKLVDISTWFRETEKKPRTWVTETFKHPCRLKKSPLTKQLLLIHEDESP